MENIDLSSVQTSELKRRLDSLLKEYDTVMASAMKNLLKLEKLREEMSNPISELSRREAGGEK